MSDMVNPMDGLVSLQNAIENGFNELTTCELFPDIKVVFDQPDGIDRFTYVRIKSDTIHAFCAFVLVEPIDGIPCFSIGYAVPEQFQNRGFAKDIIEKSIAELSNDFARLHVPRFYLEAIVGTSNEYSQKLAARFISPTPRKCTDSVSELPAIAYTRLIEL